MPPMKTARLHHHARPWLQVPPLLLALVVAACSTPDAPPAIDPEAARAEALLREANAIHDVEVGEPRIHRTMEWSTGEGESPIGVASDAATQFPIIYHVGPIMPSPKVITIYWGATRIYTNSPAPGATGPGTNDNSLVGYFLRNLGGSTWWNINTAYWDVSNGTVRHVPSAIPYSRFWAANILVPAFGSSVPDASIRNIIKTGIVLGKIPFDDNAIYTVFSGSGVNLGGNFGPGGYCAYHNWFGFTWGGQTRYLKYAVMPKAAELVACRGLNQTISPNGDYAADILVNPLAHELTETVTDPVLNAWYDAADQENADKCQWTFGTTYTTPNGAKANVVVGSKNFLVQRNWALGTSPTQKGCSLRP